MNNIEIDLEYLISNHILYEAGHPKRPRHYDKDKVIENTIWLWKEIGENFLYEEWFVLDIVPFRTKTNADLIKVLPILESLLAGCLIPKQARKGARLPFYAALEQPDDTSFGDHLHVLLQVPGGIFDDVQQLKVERKIKSLQIFPDKKSTVKIRELSPSRTLIEVARQLHYINKQTNRFNDPYAYYKKTKATKR